MEYIQRLQMAQAQAAMARSPYTQMPFGGYGMGMQQGYPGATGGFGGFGGKGGDGYGGYGGYGGGGGYSGGYGGFDGKGKGKKGKGKGKGKFGKGKGKGKDEEDGEKKEGEEGEKKEGDEEKSAPSSVAAAQREARDSRFSPIASAQREARLRFEKDILDRMQGRWGDEADPNITYVVEGSICSVSSGDGGRGFRNRLSVYGVEFCWDARRFWHYLNLPELYSQGEIAEKLEWNPAKDSPPTTQIVWNRLPPLSEVEEEAKEGEGEGEKKEEKAEEKEAEEKPAEAAPAEAAPEASA